MKPVPQIEIPHHRESRNHAHSVRFPMSDWQYQAGGFGDSLGGGKGKRQRSIRGISDEYFEKEARGHFASEAAFFAIIFVTAAVPVIEGIRGLVQFVHGVL